MSTSTILDCHIFVYSSLSLDQLATLLNDVVPGALSQGPSRTLRTAAGETDVRKNPDFDAIRSQEFPGGFLFFPYSLELYFYSAKFAPRCIVVTRLVVCQVLAVSDTWSWCGSCGPGHCAAAGT